MVSVEYEGADEPAVVRPGTHALSAAGLQHGVAVVPPHSMAGTVSCPRNTSTAGWAVEQRSSALGITQAMFLMEQCAVRQGSRRGGAQGAGEHLVGGLGGVHGDLLAASAAYR